MTGPRDGYQYTRHAGQLVRTRDLRQGCMARWEDAPESEAPPRLKNMTLFDLLRYELLRYAVTDTGSPDRKHCASCQQWLSGHNRLTATGHKDDCLLFREAPELDLQAAEAYGRIVCQSRPIGEQVTAGAHHVAGQRLALGIKENEG